MKKFLLNILIACLMAGGVLSWISWISYSKMRYVDYRLPDDIHSITLGPSTTHGCINETIIPGLKNVSRDGTDFFYLMPILSKVLQNNPQIDTVYIPHGRHYLMTGKRADFEGQLSNVWDKLPFIFCGMDKQELTEVLKDVCFYVAILNPNSEDAFLDHRHSLEDFGFNCTSHKAQNLFNDKQLWSVAWYDSVYASIGNKYKVEDLRDFSHFARAIRVCRQYDVVPVMLFTPLYQYDKWFEPEGFYDYMQTLDSDLLVADYENFEFSNDTLCRRDVHHLNVYGAREFSTYIAEHGFKPIKLGEWLKQHGH